MNFPIGESWAIIAALREYAYAHPKAHDHDKWLEWSDNLNDVVRGYSNQETKP